MDASPTFSTASMLVEIGPYSDLSGFRPIQGGSRRDCDDFAALRGERKSLTI